MSRVSVQVAGFDEMRRALGELSTRMVDAAARKAVRAAARPVIVQARANLAALQLKDSTGLLSRSIGVKVKKYKNRGRYPAQTYSAEEARAIAASGITVAIVGARRSFVQVVQRKLRYGKYEKAVPANYAHLIEKGVQPHAIGKGSSIRSRRSKGNVHPGFPARPWLEPAIASKREECQRIMAQSFAEDLRAEAARAKAKVSGARRRAA